MSVIQTAKTNGLYPKKYLEYLFEHMHKITLHDNGLKNPEVLSATFENMEKFLPWDCDIQKRFKVKEAAR
jgi:hypothetical protein